MEKPIDIIKQALRNELHASAFFAKAAELTKDDESRMLFLELGGMEDDHAAALVERLKSAPCAKDTDLPALLKQLESSPEPVLPAAEMVIIENGDPRAVLSLAIDLENRAMQTYARLAEESTDLEIKGYCLDLAKEELSHASALTKLLRSLDMDEDDRPGL